MMMRSKPTRRFVTAILVTLSVGAGIGLALRAQRLATRRVPGPQPQQEVTLLANGWRLSPAGRHVAVGNLPLAMIESFDGRFLIVSNDGYGKPSLSIIETATWTEKGRMPLADAWLGLAWHPDGRHLFSATGTRNTVQELLYQDGQIAPARTFQLPLRDGQTWAGGLAVSPDGRRLFVVRVFAQSLTAIDLASGKMVKTIDLPAEPYTCVVSPDGKTLYVSLWGGARVLQFDAASLEQRREIRVGEHPNAMTLSMNGERLFVACANTNAVWAVDLASGTAKEQISTALFPKAPPSTTPNGLGLSPDGRTLLVANADNNDVAVVDVSQPGRSIVKGFIPAGWYPTGASVSRDGRQIFIMSGKGLSSAPNPQGPTPENRYPDTQYAGSMFKGTVSIVPVPDEATLRALTKTVYELTPYSDDTRLAPADAPKGSPVPARVGDPSSIKYVFYVIRENRTYDQVFGDISRGNGDPTLVLFGEQITPNAHALAREFVLLDNFYVDAEVSYSGHAFSTAAYSNDFIERIWPANYGGRGGVYLAEGGGKMRNPFGNITAPAQGYLWDACKRAGVSVRSYGEFAESARRDGDGEMRARVPGLEGLVNPDYPSFNLKITDQHRLDIWLREFQEYEKNGKLPRLCIVRLPNDHTDYTNPGSRTPRALVADNDLALGRLIEAISSSRYWKESAIFVLEDDAQSGPDHVDAHRSVGLIVSPFAKRNAVDSTLYTTSGFLRTIELILGLPPMSQYDAAAAPAYDAFQPVAVLTAFTHLPARVPLEEMNPPTSFGAAASRALHTDEADQVPDLEGNEILWKSIRGESSVMPPPRRTGFVRPIHSVGDEDRPQ